MSLAALSALFVSAALAADVAPKPGPKCVTYDASYERAPLMSVVGSAGAKVHLQDRAETCRKPACSWVRSGYVVPGDIVFASAPLNGFRCIYVGSKGDIFSGFVPGAALRPATPPDTITPDWLVGRWAYAGDLVVFSRKKGKLVADGDGIWPGRDFPGPPGPHTGGFHGTPRISGTSVVIEDEDCRVEARRRGPYLLFSDNERCGGMNVRFTGIYVSGSTLKP